MSPPTRVVWIEIRINPASDKVITSPPTRVVWIEITLTDTLYLALTKSPPTRVVWIEMC